MITRKLLAAATALALAGCATTSEPSEPLIRTVEVEVKVDDPACARELLAGLGSIPTYPDTREALEEAPNLVERVKLVMAARKLRIAREIALVAGLEECAR